MLSSDCKGHRQEPKPVCSRYFIELQTDAAADAPRTERDLSRRKHAQEFTRIIKDWLRDNRLEKQVPHLSVTTMGQVMIMCPRPIIDSILAQDVCSIVHIRSSDQIDEGCLLRSARDRVN